MLVVQNGQGYHLFIASPRKLAFLIEHVSNAAGHSSGEISSRRTKHDYASTSHVFASVIANSFNHGRSSTVPHTETFARCAADVGFATRRAIESDVTDNHILFRDERCFARRVDNNLAARKSFAEVIVGVAFQAKRHAARHERAKTLAGRTVEVQTNCVFRKSVWPMASGDFAANHRSHRSIHVLDWQAHFDLLSGIEGRLAQIQ